VTADELIAWVEDQRRATIPTLDPDTQRAHAQYFTPAPVAQLMAGMLSPRRGSYRLLDPGAGIGVLAAQAVTHLIDRSDRLKSIHVTAYEIDAVLVARLKAVLGRCEAFAAERRVKLTFDIRARDFLADACALLGTPGDRYDGVILNPPYGKINTASEVRKQARMLGAEVPNVYAAFWTAAVQMTKTGGDVVAITPRSFCNGTYFTDFRRFLLGAGALRRLHVFDARDEAFSDHSVLQENLITVLTVGAKPDTVLVTAQSVPGATMRERTVPYGRVVQPNETDRFIHVVPDANADLAASFMARMVCTLADLGIAVSTGPVVDFRASDLLRAEPTDDTIALLYPAHLRGGRVVWSPKNGKKPMSIEEAGAATKRLLVADGRYVLVKRFTAKEERRRVVAALYEGDTSSGRGVAIENHLNYFHRHGRPLDDNFATGLVLYLNSSNVDDYVRQFSGHTQVNAGDLRSLRYPPAATLAGIGAVADRARLADPTYYDELTTATGPAALDPDTSPESALRRQPVA
jgi:adenine-specific DNA-methyltransferase